MPEIHLQKVVSFSSEDKTHTAENLLKSETYRKWKSASVGEKQVTAIIQFDEPSQIHSIDIGNENSAFVEVLVGRASAQSDQDYQVLLVASSFMSPGESKQGNNPHRVRMFGSEKMSSSVKDQKWDRVKIVCTQPFNKNVQYGLSFIKFHSPPSGSPQAKKNPTPKKLGKFALKDDDDDEDKVTIGSFFSKKGKTEQKPLTGAAAVRAASSTAAVATATTPSPRPAAKVTSPSSQSTKRKLSHDDDDDDDDKPPLRKHQSAPSKGASPPPMKKTKSETSVKQPTNKATPRKTPPTAQQQKRKAASKPMKEEEEEERDFGSLMEDVVFVLSGYVNPQRASLRDKAMEMGAAYKPDWDPTCTHLVCAFPNTPKYQQVQRKGGKIVSHKWIEHCYKKGVLLSWKRFRLDDDSSSEEEEDEPPPKPKPKPRTTPAKPAAAGSSKGASPSKTTTTAKASPAKNASPAKAIKNDDDDYGDSTDVDSDAGPSSTKKQKVQDSSGDDTEDEIRRIQEGNKKVKVEEDQYGGSTDEEPEHTTPKNSPAKTPQKQTHGKGDADDMPLPDLPDFFTGKHFFLYGDFPASERRLVLRYITAFNGSMEDYMCDKVTHVITNEEWDDNFDEALSDNSDLTFVRPQWVYKCSEKGKMVPHQPYIVVPKA
ncbi:DNA repair protein XRCC1-like [Branchiostoma floridae]|uniref:DNA repair protein XRCC1 n=1 Tax=Branchiostoma floridae TaxID=7739 RepID=A0A9J7L9R7_BRAFL|nr:DNA repair protein XRCC1-like [Branchiostoma floridae]